MLYEVEELTVKMDLDTEDLFHLFGQSEFDAFYFIFYFVRNANVHICILRSTYIEAYFFRIFYSLYYYFPEARGVELFFLSYYHLEKYFVLRIFICTSNKVLKRLAPSRSWPDLTFWQVWQPCVGEFVIPKKYGDRKCIIVSVWSLNLYTTGRST